MNDAERIAESTLAFLLAAGAAAWGHLYPFITGLTALLAFGLTIHNCWSAYSHRPIVVHVEKDENVRLHR